MIPQYAPVLGVDGIRSGLANKKPRRTVRSAGSVRLTGQTYYSAAVALT